MDAFEVMRETLESTFAESCRLHDKVLEACCAKWQVANVSDTVRDKNRTPEQEAAAVEAMALSRLADAVKAIMLVNFPVAAREWHGPERD